MSGVWITTKHTDELIQVRLEEPWPARYYIEQFAGGPWFVVDRHPPETWRSSIMAPIVSGPFEHLDAAKAAYLVMLVAEKEQ